MSHDKQGVFARKRRADREAGPRIAHAVIAVVAAFMVFAVIWSTQTELQELARAEGEIAPSGELLRVDHFDGGVIAEILANVGDEVSAGQALARIEHPGLASEIAEIQAEISSLDADIASTRWLLTGSGDDPASAFVRTQRELHFAQREVLQVRSAYLDAAAAASSDLSRNIRLRLSLSEQSLTRFEELRSRGVVSEAQLAEQAEETADVRSEMLQAEANYSQALVEAREAEAALAEAALIFREQHLAELHDLERRRHLISAKLASLEARRSRQVILAPEDGFIQSVGVNTIGEVVPQGGLLFEILPADEQLVAIAKLSPNDIGHIEEGSQVTLKLNTFDARAYGDITGEITLISPTTIIPERADPYFRAVIALDSNFIGQGADRKRLRAGMTLNAEILTSRGSVLNYLLKPIRGLLSNSMTER